MVKRGGTGTNRQIIHSEASRRTIDVIDFFITEMQQRTGSHRLLTVSTSSMSGKCETAPRRLSIQRSRLEGIKVVAPAAQDANLKKSQGSFQASDHMSVPA